MKTPRSRLRPRKPPPPSAAEWCRLARTWTWHATMAMSATGLVILIPFLWPVTVPLFLLSLATLFIAAMTWAVMVSLFYAKFSLAHLLGSVMWIGLCGSLIVVADGVWAVAPAVMLAFYLFLAYFYIVMQDPGWGRFRPFRAYRKEPPTEAEADPQARA